MSDQISGLISRLARLVNSITGRGRVTTTNDSGNVQLVQIQTNSLETIDGLPRLAEFGFTSVPPNGSDAVLVFLGGGRTNGAVIATGHQASRPKGLAAGEVKIYSQDGKFVHLTASGGVIVEAKNQPVTVNDATTVTINAATKVRMVTPRFECTGDIVDNCDTTGRSMAADRVIYDGHTHPVPNVQGGSSTVTSNAPSQPQ